MDFVALLSMRPHLTSAERDGALARRAGWKPPSGIRPIAEYWPASDRVTVVYIFSAERFEDVMELELEWTDVFSIEVHPAVSAEEGLRIGGDVMSRLSRSA